MGQQDPFIDGCGRDENFFDIDGNQPLRSSCVGKPRDACTARQRNSMQDLTLCAPERIPIGAIDRLSMCAANPQRDTRGQTTGSRPLESSQIKRAARRFG